MGNHKVGYWEVEVEVDHKVRLIDVLVPDEDERPCDCVDASAASIHAAYRAFPDLVEHAKPRAVWVRNGYVARRLTYPVAYLRDPRHANRLW